MACIIIFKLLITDNIILKYIFVNALVEEHIYIAENSYCTFESFIFNNKYWDIISIINCLVQYFFEENILSVINHFSKKNV